MLEKGFVDRLLAAVEQLNAHVWPMTDLQSMDEMRISAEVGM